MNKNLNKEYCDCEFPMLRGVYGNEYCGLCEKDFDPEEYNVPPKDIIN